LLVAHGADLNGKSLVDETPLGECGVAYIWWKGVAMNVPMTPLSISPQMYVVMRR
jgi:hypothetical protein